LRKSTAANSLAYYGSAPAVIAEAIGELHIALMIR
jgi:hypothetical protein